MRTFMISEETNHGYNIIMQPYLCSDWSSQHYITLYLHKVKLELTLSTLPEK